MPLPSDVVDPHHHFIDPANEFQGFLCGTLGAPAYTAEMFTADLGPLNERVSRTVHVEAIPDDGLAEATWVEGLAAQGRCKVAGIVAACNLADDDAEQQLEALAKLSRVRGIRYIIDYDGGPWAPGCDNATHAACSRHNLDYLRDPVAAPLFERGFAKLAAHGFSFDLQCAPAQLPAAAAMLARHPEVRVCLDHLGKPRHLSADGGARDAAELAAWRAGMALLAAQPQVVVKLSMLGYAVPGWCVDEKKEALIKSLVLETIGLFGANRCMFSTNYHIGAALSDSDGKSSDGLEPTPLFERFAKWVEHLPDDDQRRLFAGTAAEFYRI